MDTYPLVRGIRSGSEPANGDPRIHAATATSAFRLVLCQLTSTLHANARAPHWQRSQEECSRSSHLVSSASLLPDAMAQISRWGTPPAMHGKRGTCVLRYHGHMRTTGAPAWLDESRTEVLGFLSQEPYCPAHFIRNDFKDDKWPSTKQKI